jgi:hypothetical protein
MSDRRFSRGGGSGGGSNNGGGAGNGGGGETPDFGLTAWDETSEQKPPRDYKKVFLVAGLAILSWVATYVGMLELIEANIGDLPIMHKIIIGFSVGMLMTMVVWLLDQMFQPVGFFSKLAYAGGYLFLTLISIGFGFGFYWKVLESRGEGTPKPPSPRCRLHFRPPPRASKACRRRWSASRTCRSPKPKSNAPQARRAPIPSPVTARAANCATMTPVGSRSPRILSKVELGRSRTTWG